MKCPFCNKEMRVMAELDKHDFRVGTVVEVVGHCWDCDYDAVWLDVYEHNKHEHPVEQILARKYFFG